MSSEAPACSRCGCTDTPQWRRQGHVLLCNACGIKVARQARKAQRTSPGGGAGSGEEGGEEVAAPRRAKVAKTSHQPRSAAGSPSSEAVACAPPPALQALHSCGSDGRGGGIAGGGGGAPQREAPGGAPAQQPQLLQPLLAGLGQPPTPHAWNIDDLLGMPFELLDFEIPSLRPGEAPTCSMDGLFSAAPGGVPGGVHAQASAASLQGMTLPSAWQQPNSTAAWPAGAGADAPEQQRSVAPQTPHDGELSSSGDADAPAAPGSGARGGGTPLAGGCYQQGSGRPPSAAASPAVDHSYPRPPSQQQQRQQAGPSHNHPGAEYGSGLPPSNTGRGGPQQQHHHQQHHYAAAAYQQQHHHHHQQQQQHGGSAHAHGGAHPSGIPMQQQQPQQLLPEHGYRPAQSPLQEPQQHLGMAVQQQQHHHHQHQGTPSPAAQRTQQHQQAVARPGGGSGHLESPFGRAGSGSGGHALSPEAAPLSAQQQQQQQWHLSGGQHGGQHMGGHRSLPSLPEHGYAQPPAHPPAPLPRPPSQQQLHCPSQPQSPAQQLHRHPSAQALHSQPQSPAQPLHRHPSQQAMVVMTAAQQRLPPMQQHQQGGPGRAGGWQGVDHCEQPQQPQQGTLCRMPTSCSFEEAHTTTVYPHGNLSGAWSAQGGPGAAAAAGGCGQPGSQGLARVQSHEVLTPQPYTVGPEACGGGPPPDALSRTLGHPGSARRPARQPHDTLPGKVVKTLATLPDVQLLYQSCPGPNGIALQHIYPGLTCQLQLVRVGPPPQGNSPSEGSFGSGEAAGEAGAAAGRGGGGPAQEGWRLTTRASLCNELSEAVVTFRDDVIPEEACVLPHMVKGCAAWDSGEGWLVLFDQFSQLHQFAAAIKQAARLVRGQAAWAQAPPQ